MAVSAQIQAALDWVASQIAACAEVATGGFHQQPHIAFVVRSKTPNLNRAQASPFSNNSAALLDDFNLAAIASRRTRAAFQVPPFI